MLHHASRVRSARPDAAHPRSPTRTTVRLTGPVVIGDRAVIGDGAMIRDSIVLPGTVVEPSSIVIGATLGRAGIIPAMTPRREAAAS